MHFCGLPGRLRRSKFGAFFFRLRLLADLKISPFRLSPDLVTLSGAISACAKGIIWQMATSLLRDLEAMSSAVSSFASSSVGMCWMSIAGLEYTIDTTLQVTGLVSRGKGMIASVTFAYMLGARIGLQHFATTCSAWDDDNKCNQLMIMIIMMTMMKVMMTTMLMMMLMQSFHTILFQSVLTGI